jgi:hypothetical protein
VEGLVRQYRDSPDRRKVLAALAAVRTTK